MSACPLIFRDFFGSSWRLQCSFFGSVIFPGQKIELLSTKDVHSSAQLDAEYADNNMKSAVTDCCNVSGPDLVLAEPAKNGSDMGSMVASLPAYQDTPHMAVVWQPPPENR